MKRIKYIFISSFLALFITSSCEDSYNIVQDGELNEDAITTVPLLQQYFNGAYAVVDIDNEVGFTGIFTDETSIGTGNGGQNLGLHSFFLTRGENYASSIWYSHYFTITKMNRIMRMVTDPDGSGELLPQVQAPTDPTELETYNQILAQVRALRAFSYFQLLTYFSTDLKDDDALGVMFFTHVPTNTERLPRVANGIIFAQIEDDLNFAYANVSPAATYKFVSKNMINALRARMYLYRGNYVLAKQYAEDVIGTSGLSLTAATPAGTSALPTNPNYSLVIASNPLTAGSATAAWNNLFYGTSSNNPYRRMFTDAIQGEVIYALDKPNAGTVWSNIAGQFTTNTTNTAGSPYFEMSRALFNKLAATPGDVRRYVNVDPSSRMNANYATDPNYKDSDVIIIDKYPGKGSFPLRNDHKVFRLSEMYFILAECLAHEGNLNGATNSVASIIQRFKNTRNFLPANQTQPLPTYPDARAAFAAIMDERRLELAFEGHRYIDIKRLGPLANQTIDRDARDDSPGAALSIPNNDYRFTLPIPTDEINANPGIQQNPGYL